MFFFFKITNSLKMRTGITVTQLLHPNKGALQNLVKAHSKNVHTNSPSNQNRQESLVLILIHYRLQVIPNPREYGTGPRE